MSRENVIVFGHKFVQRKVSIRSRLDEPGERAIFEQNGGAGEVSIRSRLDEPGEQVVVAVVRL